MYDPIYGNHVGIVVNNLDPENRGRLQIFIPHLSNNLLPTWNNELKDISFISAEANAKLGSVLDKLKNTLPWAETAVPSFGGATSGPVKYDGNASPLPLVPNATPEMSNADSVPSLNLSKDGNSQSANRTGNLRNVSEINENVLKYLYSIGAAETGYQQKDAYGKNLLNGINPDGSIAQPNTIYYNKYVWEEYNKNGGNIQAASAKFGDFGPFQFNSENAKSWGVDYNAPVSTQLVQMANYLKKTGDYDRISNGQTVNIKGYNVLSGDFSTYFKAIKNHPDEIAKAQNLSKDQIIANVNNLDTNGLLKPQTFSPIFNNFSSPVQMTDSLAAECGGASPYGQGASAGFFSKPAVGAKVWVFFYGGDAQRPVYFASVVEAPNYQVANQNVASTG